MRTWPARAASGSLAARAAARSAGVPVEAGAALADGAGTDEGADRGGAGSLPHAARNSSGTARAAATARGDMRTIRSTPAGAEQAAVRRSSAHAGQQRHGRPVTGVPVRLEFSIPRGAEGLVECVLESL